VNFCCARANGGHRSDGIQRIGGLPKELPALLVTALSNGT
jgi:hypothetical protein